MRSLLEASGNMPPKRLMAPWIEKDIREQNRNLVLNEMEAGTIAFIAGYLGAAEALFSDAQRQIETIYASNPTATAARGKFVPEASKEFKGDPYERAMTGYYLGLIDLARGEFDNARASFRFAMLQDTMSASETYQDDMAIGSYLIGWTHFCEGNRQSAAEEFGRAQAIRPDLRPPAPSHNTLLIAEIGKAPRKVAAGTYGELLTYEPGTKVPERQVAFRVDGKQISAVLAEDLFYQASTRGGSAVESIRAGKASFKSSAGTVGSVGKTVGVAAIGGSLLASGEGAKQLRTLGAVAGIVGIISDNVARNTEAEADARAWSSLPGAIYLATAEHKGERIEAGFFDHGGRIVHALPAIVRKPVKSNCQFAYSRALGNRRPDQSVAGWITLPPLEGEVEEQPKEIPADGAKMLDMIKSIRNGT